VTILVFQYAAVRSFASTIIAPVIIIATGVKGHLQTCLRAATLCLLFALTVLATAKTPPQNRRTSGIRKPATTVRTPSTASQPAVSSMPPFVGTNSETWEQFGVNQIPNGTSILGGIATISGIKMVTEHRFRMCAVWGVPSDGIMLMDQDRPNDLVTISFSQPVSAFGAYWGSGFECWFGDSASILTFQDVNGNVIGSDSFVYQGDGTLEWHGYAFATPVKTITRTAGDGEEGFAMDGLQATVAFVNLKITSIGHPAANTIHLNCIGAPNVLNRIEWSPDLSPGSFHTLASVMATANGAFQYDDTSAGTKKFYRVVYP
jgi:hypothetical protein